MSEQKSFQTVTFYEFKPFSACDLPGLRDKLKASMRRLGIKGTVILAEEGFNSTVSGDSDAIRQFVNEAGATLDTQLNYRSSFSAQIPFRRIDVKIKPEIVTLKKKVDMAKWKATYVGPAEWNSLISNPDVLLLDTRNHYEYRNGTFKGAINPNTSKFSDLPEFVAENLDPARHGKIAMFCTGGIRCEKFAPYMKQLGFAEVFQLDGGILKYLEEINPEDSLWDGECFVFDDRVTVDHHLQKGIGPDYSLVEKDGACINDLSPEL